MSPDRELRLQYLTEPVDRAFRLAVREGDLEGVSQTLAAGALVECRGRDGFTALHIAADAGNDSLCTLLLQRGAALESFTQTGLTPLMLAGRMGHLPACRVLLAHGANVHARDGSGTPVLVGCMEIGSDPIERVCALLLDHGAGVDEGTADGDAMLHLAVARGHEAVCRLLLERGADVHKENGRGQTALDLALLRCASPHEDVSRLRAEHDPVVGLLRVAQRQRELAEELGDTLPAASASPSRVRL